MSRKALDCLSWLTYTQKRMNHNPAHFGGLPLPEQDPDHPNARPEVLGVRQLGAGVWGVRSLSNAAWVETGEGSVLIDSAANDARLGEALTSHGASSIQLLIYTHGHKDHVFTAPRWQELSTAAEVPVVAHALTPLRMRTDELLANHAERVRSLQFRRRSLAPDYWGELVYPDRLYDGECSLKVGNRAFRLIHVRGETDDATVVLEENSRIVFAGDTLLSGWPNLGNPFKEPRYGADWIEALKTIRSLEPSAIMPGHGSLFLLTGEEIETCLRDTIDALEFVYSEVVRRLNAGQSLAQMVAEIRLPATLESSRYLRQTYSRVEFAVVALHRGIAGWWTGDPSSLFPLDPTRAAVELRRLLGGDDRLLARARELWDEGDRQTAIELVQVALRGRDDARDAVEARRLRLRFAEELLQEDRCQMSRAAWLAIADADRQRTVDIDR